MITNESQPKQMQQILVKGYVRNKQPQVQVEPDNTVGLVVAASVIILSAVVFWNITVIAGLLVGAAYGVKTIYLTPRPVEAVTEAVEAPKAKRHYEHRLTVRHYQTNKVIKV